MIANYIKFANKVISLGMAPRQCKSDHWQIIGGRTLVNIWPFTSKGIRMHAVCEPTSRYIYSIEEAIDVAKPEEAEPKAASRGGMQTRRRRKAHLLAADSHCHYCRDRLTKQTATLDHYKPIALGGTNEIENIRLACFDCNLRKADMPPQEFEAIIAHEFALVGAFDPFHDYGPPSE